MAKTKTTSKPNEKRYPVDQPVVDYYVASKAYTQVRVVYCTKCGAALGLEVMDPKAKQRRLKKHHDGMTVIPFENSPADDFPPPMAAYRNRLDGVMGYQCAAMIPNPDFDPKDEETEEPAEIPCGNDTRLGDAEVGIVKTGNHPSVLGSVYPHHEAMVKSRMQQDGIKPRVTVKGKVTTIESFAVERVQ